MPKPRKFDDEDLLQITRELYESKGGDASALSFRALADFAAENGRSAGEHLFRRSPAVRDYIDTLKGLSDAPEEKPAEVFVGLDVEALIRNCSSILDLKKRLSEISAETEQYYLDRVRAREEADQLSKQLKEKEKQYRELEKENRSLKADLKKAGKEKDQLLVQFQTYVYPNAAIRILSERIPSLTIPPYCIPEGLDRLREELCPIGAGQDPSRPSGPEDPEGSPSAWEAMKASSRGLIDMLNESEE